MSNANFEFNLNQENPWAKLSMSAKVATVLVGMVVAAASLAASIFLAGAALFGGLVMVAYTAWNGRKHKQPSQPQPKSDDKTVIDGEVTEVANG